MLSDFTVPSDRRPEERYRVYRLRAGVLELLSTTPSEGGIGVALVTHAEEGDLTFDDGFGVLDAFPEGVDETRVSPPETGEWLVNPYARR